MTYTDRIKERINSSDIPLAYTEKMIEIIDDETESMLEMLDNLKWDEVELNEEFIDDDDNFSSYKDIYNAGRKQGRYEAFVKFLRLFCLHYV